MVSKSTARWRRAVNIAPPFSFAHAVSIAAKKSGKKGKREEQCSSSPRIELPNETQIGHLINNTSSSFPPSTPLSLTRTPSSDHFLVKSSDNGTNRQKKKVDDVIGWAMKLRERPSSLISSYSSHPWVKKSKGKIKT